MVGAAGRLLTMGPGGALTAFARGAGGYQTVKGTEPYLTVTSGGPQAGNHCSFGINDVFALEPAKQRPGVVMVSPAGAARRFASLPAGRSLSGIAFDGTGRFGHRLLVTGMHLHYPGFAHLVREGSGYRLIPEAWRHAL